MVREQSLAIPLQELVASGCLSDCTFTFNNNNNNEGIEGDSDSIRQLRCVNAAKLSLLLAQTLAKFDDVRIGIYSTSLKLDNFVVKLASSSQASGICRDGAAGDETREQANPDAVESDDILPLDFKDDPFTENDDTLGLLSTFFDGNEHSSVDTDEPSSLSDGNDQISGSPDIDIFKEINAGSGTDKNWTLMGIEVRSNLHFSCATNTLEESPNQDLLKKKHLGKLIHEVFSPRDNKALPAAFETLLVLKESGNTDDAACNDEGDLGERHPKLQRFKKKTLFSDLLESGHYPVSVCRLLADSPFTNIEAVVEDLEHMCSNPHLYLHDPEDGFFSKLRFGLGCFGRTKQVKRMLEVASNLEGNDEKEKPSQSSSDYAYAIFVSGIAGSGKSFLVQRVADYLITQDWIVIKAKFHMGLEHESQDVVLSAFDDLVNQLVNMREGVNKEDIKYSHHATQAILDVLDRDSLSSLALRLPNLKRLVSVIDSDHIGISADGTAESDKGNSHWQQVFLLSSLMGAVLSADRQIMICYDDLQWCESTTLSLICEVIISMGSLPHARNRFLFVGMYRDDEVTCNHPFTTHYDGRQCSKSVNITDIHLPSMSKDDVTEMIMSELRLPKRIIHQFSDIIHKKTSGHALFVVQLLNSLVRDNIVVYSPSKHRYDWDFDQLNALQTCDGVASLIISNIKKLPSEALASLRVLSCFGMHIYESTIQYLGSCSDKRMRGGDIVPSLPILIDAGILKTTSFAHDTIQQKVLTFAHDMIQQKVYNGIPNDQRQQIHLCIGLFLGSNTKLDDPIQDTSLYSRRYCDEEDKKEASADLPQTVFFIATDHINNASELVVDQLQISRFAGWNLCAATISSRNSNFQAALHYYRSGIAFLGSEKWTDDTQKLCYNLYKGAAFAYLAVGEAELVPQYANAIIENVPFEHSLDAQCLLIRSLDCTGSKNQETVDTALTVLDKLGVSIPFAPKLYLSHLVDGINDCLAPSIVLESMRKTEEIASKYNMDEVIAHQAVKIDKSKVDVLSILDSVILAGHRLGSPYLALIVCETVNYSLEQNCVCAHSALSFCYFGYMKMSLNDDFKEGQRWGKMALKTLERSKHRSPFIRTRIMVNFLILIWDRSLRDSAQEMFNAYELGMKSGDVSSASMALLLSLQYLYMEGVNLSSLQKKYDYYLKQFAKFNKETAKRAILAKMNIDFLIGVPCESFSIFDGEIPDEAYLLADALSKKNRILVSSIYFRRYFHAFYSRQFSEQLKWSKLAMEYSAKIMGPRMIKMFIYVTMGIAGFHLYREGKGEIYYNMGKRMLNELEKHVQNCSEDLFNDKVLMLQAENFAAICDVEKAKKAYDDSIRTARNFFRINDQALAYELQGNYLSSIVEIPQARESYKKAHECYIKWGALTTAKQIYEKHRLDLGVDVKVEINPMKHSRDW